MDSLSLRFTLEEFQAFPLQHLSTVNPWAWTAELLFIHQSPAERPPPPRGPSGSPRALCAGSPTILETDHPLPDMAAFSGVRLRDTRPWWRWPEGTKGREFSCLLPSKDPPLMAPSWCFWHLVRWGPWSWVCGPLPSTSPLFELSAKKLGQWCREPRSWWSSAEGRDLVCLRSNTTSPEWCFAAVTIPDPRNWWQQRFSLVLGVPILAEALLHPILLPGSGLKKPSSSRTRQTSSKRGRRGQSRWWPFPHCCCSSPGKTSLGKTKPGGQGAHRREGKTVTRHDLWERQTTKATQKETSPAGSCRVLLKTVTISAVRF